MTRAREQLLDRCIEFLQQTGFGELSLREIAAGAGTSHRMLIYHFGGREGLLAAVVARNEEQQRIARLLIERVQILSDGIDIQRRESGWIELAGGLAPATIGGEMLQELRGHRLTGNCPCRRRPHRLGHLRRVGLDRGEGIAQQRRVARLAGTCDEVDQLAPPDRAVPRGSDGLSEHRGQTIVETHLSPTPARKDLVTSL